MPTSYVIACTVSMMKGRTFRLGSAVSGARDGESGGGALQHDPTPCANIPACLRIGVASSASTHPRTCRRVALGLSVAHRETR